MTTNDVHAAAANNSEIPDDADLRDVEKEGSPTLLGDKRIEGSVWPKSIRGSTPKIKGSCQIEKAANESAHFMRFYVPCPHCGEEQYLKFGDDAHKGRKHFLAYSSPT